MRFGPNIFSILDAKGWALATLRVTPRTLKPQDSRRSAIALKKSDKGTECHLRAQEAGHSSNKYNVSFYQTIIYKHRGIRCIDPLNSAYINHLSC